MKRAFVFSLDAIMVLGLLLTLTFFLTALSFSYSSPELKYQRLYYAGKDLLNVIQEAKLSSMEDNALVQEYLATGILKQEDLDKTILDVIGSFWASGNLTEARNLSKSIFSQILNGTNFDYELLIDGQEIHEKNTTVTTYLARLSAIVSGYDIGKPVSGYSARVRLSKVNKVSSSYVYFGGYIGDGNISVNFTLPQFDTIVNSSMEMNAGNNFTLLINGNPAGSYLKNSADSMSADQWTLNSYYFQYFVPGYNNITINFIDNRSMYIGGGYLKISYNTSQLADSNEMFGANATKTEYIPGIDGLINIYSSYYTPGTLKNMSIYLHYLSNHTIFVTVGNTTIYQGNSSTPKVEDLNSTYLSGLLDYSSLSNKTVPFRIGLLNVSYLTIGAYGIGDPVLVTDVSGSMDDCAVDTPPFIQPLTCKYNCWIGSKSCYVSDPIQCTDNVCGGSCWGGGSGHYVCNTKLTLAKDADKQFVGILLNQSISGNRVGLVAYSTSISSYQNLTTNQTFLNNSIDVYTSGGSTCICCGINRATNMSRDLSNGTRRRINVVMTDGEANVRCSASENRATADLNSDGVTDAKDDAINASCMAYQKYGIITYTVGFAVSESQVDNRTLNKTAECGHGKYYYSNVTELASTFRQIALEVINASYVAQTIEVTGQANLTKLYPDSYIKLDYASAIQPAGYGEVTLTFESPKFGNISGPMNITDQATKTKEGWYYVPENMQVVDSKITSYSSNYWTDRLYVNSSKTSDWARIYWLGDYGINYTSLGDPFIVQIPVSYIGTGNNSVRIGTGLNSSEGRGASLDDRIIYTLKIGGLAFEQYSDIFPKAKGSTVTVYYDMNGDNIYDGYSQISYGTDPTDIFDPQNDSIDDAFMRLIDSLNFIWDANPNSYGNGTTQNPYDGINQTNPIDLQITSDVNFDAVVATGIPSLWGPAIMEIRIWS